MGGGCRENVTRKVKGGRGLQGQCHEKERRDRVFITTKVLGGGGGGAAVTVLYEGDRRDSVTRKEGGGRAGVIGLSSIQLSSSFEPFYKYSFSFMKNKIFVEELFYVRYCTVVL